MHFVTAKVVSQTADKLHCTTSTTTAVGRCHPQAVVDVAAAAAVALWQLLPKQPLAATQVEQAEQEQRMKLSNL